MIFDKFLPEGKDISLPRKFINLFSTLLGTDLNHRLSDLMRDCPCEIGHDEPGIAGGMYRVVILRKKYSRQFMQPAMAAHHVDETANKTGNQQINLWVFY